MTQTLRIQNSEKYLKMGLLAALLICGFASTSYAAESCAANMNDLKSHPDSENGCGVQDLRKQFNRIPAGGLNGPMGYVVEFKMPAANENFYVMLSGKKTPGQICCAKGAWSIKGQGAIKVIPNGVEIGGYKFLRDDRRVDFQTPMQVARTGRG